METKSTNEVKGDYDRVSASECLGSLIELHGIVMEDDLFVIPDADGTAVLYNDGKIRFDEIADIEARCSWASCSATAICSTFPVPNRSRRAYTRMAGGVQSLKFLPVALPDISGVNCTGSWATIRRSIDGKQKNRTVVIVRFFSRRIFTAVACRVPVSAFAGRAVAATCRHGFPPRYAPRASGRDLRGTPGIGVPPLLSR